MHIVAAAVVLSAAWASVAADPVRTDPLKVCLVSASAEYRSDQSLALLQERLETGGAAACSRVFGADKGDTLQGLEAIDACDVMVLFARRVTLPPEQLARVKAYFRAGRPVVGIRTASHAFQNYLEFDREVLGGNYTGHYGPGPPVQTTILEKARSHPVLAGVEPFASPYSLYRNTGLAHDVEVLVTGSAAGHTEPVAWTRTFNGGRIFYTSLGGPDDFRNEHFLRLIVNAIWWVTKRPVPTSPAVGPATGGAEKKDKP